MVYIIVQTTQAIGKTVKKFEETGMVSNIDRPMHHRIARAAENIAIVNENSQELGLSYCTL